MKLSPTEKQRLAALRRLKLLDTPPEERFERLTRIAKQHYQVRTALFSLVDEKRQWFKSRQGLEATEIPRSLAFCDHAIKQDKVFLVPDATQDARFRDNPMVIGAPHIRFYAGMPVREPGGFKIGTFCIIDDKPRELVEMDMDVLRSLASIAEDELERAYLLDGRSEFVQASHLGRSIQRALGAFLQSTDLHAAFELVLNDMLTLTGSQFGFIGEVLRKENDDPYLKIGAITNIAWNAETQALYQEVQRTGMVFDRLDNLMGRVLLKRSPVIANDPAHDRRAGGLPPGHPPLHAYIGIPVFADNEMIGVVGLANRDGGYDKRIADELHPLLQTVGNMIERARVQRERLAHHRKMEKAAYYDALTGLPNRRRLIELLTRELAVADERQRMLSICFLDLDGFKQINDEHGHAAGDAVLKTVAERLKRAIREHDVVARLGGDEFVAVLHDVEDEQVYNRILQIIHQPISHRHVVLQLSGSMGVTRYPQDNSDIEHLLRHADQAMYAAKESGKNRVKLFNEHIHNARKERLCILELIQQAITEHQLDLYYQPIQELTTHQVIGYEASLIWHHPDEGLMQAERFLPHLEYTEFTESLGRFVLDGAVKTLQSFAARSLALSVSVDISLSYLLSDRFIDDLAQRLEPLPDAQRNGLILNVAEWAALDDPARVIARLTACRELRVGVCLNHFGLGKSSLEHFRRLPITDVKMDPQLVQGLDGERQLVARGVVSLATSFGRRVLAQGIADPQAEARLLELGCHYGQGPLYGAPQPMPTDLSTLDHPNPASLASQDTHQ